mmetsp:Transcript_109130/g.163202  ORF Transcript_109130/g.163202 Transcript_109130/m.163202 type:complete len:272 (+) Transcript_109130:33-848(+)|eukprot:CAMPEP_0117030742 /NCGR_PEP_ID=MMETSP0472-20121206/22166_1 /TAXON_ID=693140 ORGANISM="Tiarina fusus, Strain LIS" /NCGR_SAMPLE_ID=MMETSP0472 /ASSEMBLY_ACC=CAM_ASM_000603 /LENGTH=271 /DNA_ID=CAMNT_0004738903 /DNA_START=19 /DNA_END=834 /DNA_ORIENTATION=+
MAPAKTSRAPHKALPHDDHDDDHDGSIVAIKRQRYDYSFCQQEWKLGVLMFVVVAVVRFAVLFGWIDGNDDNVTQEQGGAEEEDVALPVLSAVELQEREWCENAKKSPGFYVGIVFSFLLALMWKKTLCKERFRKDADNRRRQLQQELEDPQLHLLLERLYPVLTEREARIARLEKRIENWDSEAVAVRELRVQIRRFRGLTLATATLWLFSYYYDGMRRCLLGLCLDCTLVWTFFFVQTYWTPIDSDDEMESTNDGVEVEFQDLEPLIAV